LNEIADVARLIDGKKIHRNVEFYIQTSKVVEELSRRMGLAQTIEQAGAKFWPDTCLIISTTRRRGFETLMTTSAKFAYYTPIEVEADVILANIKNCVDAAINGEV
jgi:predicted aconitase